MPDLLNSLLSAVPWPFPVRPSLDNMSDPETRHAIATALSLVGLSVLLVTVAMVMRRGRIIAVVLALTLIVLQLPSLDLLLVAAYPTSYRRSPTGFTAASVTEGRKVFATTCIGCHGKAGDGVGGLGEVADLRQPHIWEHPVGDLFWFISHGIEGPDGSLVMPAFGTILPEPVRWSLIDYVYALNAGAVTRGLDGWPHRVPAPEVALSCPTIAAHRLADLHGKAIRLILGEVTQPIATLAPVNGITVISVWMPGDEAETVPPAGIDCVAQGGADAYAILAGEPDGHVVPARFLIDPDAVLRSVWRTGDGGEAADPARLLEEVRTICTEPLTIEPGEPHEHHH
jgi:mono/diheme cytochrome c family protein